MPLVLRRLLALCLILPILLCLSDQAQAQKSTTAFTYQGYLEESGTPFSGTFDFRFVLYDAKSGGSEISGPVLIEDAVVTDGVFSVLLDFGTKFGKGVPYLEIGIREGTSTKAFKTLSPREALRPAPLAIIAQQADVADEAKSLPNVTVDASGDVGIGTSTPSSRLTVDGAIESTSGGIVFPDGTTQTTASTGASNAWLTGGNSGTDPASGNYLGTADDAPFEVRVNGSRAVRIEPSADAGGTVTPNVVLGSASNDVTDGAYGAAIGGGERNTVSANTATVAGGEINTASGDDATVGGGSINTASGADATVSGGNGNTASGTVSSVGGGIENKATASGAVVMGGRLNTASGIDAAVGGGSYNKASASYATVPGGAFTEARATNSFAAGFYSRVRPGDEGTFIWSDNSQSPADSLISTAPHQFLVRASGGIWLGSGAARPGVSGLTHFLETSTGAYLSDGGTWTNSSSRALKTGFSPVDPQAVLAKVASLDLTRWHYRAENEDVQHLGPMAEDFYEAFGLGSDPATIGTVDADGVSLAAIQGLLERLRSQERTVEAQQETIEKQQREIEHLRENVARLQHLHERMAELEKRLNTTTAAE